MILAELLPDRATPILARGRAYGEEPYRLLGVHNASAVVEGASVGGGDTVGRSNDTRL